MCIRDSDNLDNFQEISKTNVGAALVVTGTLVETPEAKQPFELQAESVVVEGASALDYTLQKQQMCIRDRPARSG